MGESVAGQSRVKFAAEALRGQGLEVDLNMRDVQRLDGNSAVVLGASL